jgi:hypothetical protein
LQGCGPAGDLNPTAQPFDRERIPKRRLAGGQIPEIVFFVRSCFPSLAR